MPRKPPGVCRVSTPAPPADHGVQGQRGGVPAVLRHCTGRATMVISAPMKTLSQLSKMDQDTIKKLTRRIERVEQDMAILIRAAEKRAAAPRRKA